MKIYGIKTCSTVSKARKFLKDHDIDVEFIDLKEVTLTITQIDNWLQYTNIDKIFNKHSTTYRILGLKELNLDDEAKKVWLCKESMLLKRPLLELDNALLVGFSEDEYKKIKI